MPKAPLPPEVAELFARPNPAVVAVLRPKGAPMSVATWYLVEDDGTVLLNMDAGRARLDWMREHPEVALTALKEGEWYTHVSIRGTVVRWEDDPERALVAYPEEQSRALWRDQRFEAWSVKGPAPG